jgi:hypothetical protein
VLMYRRRPSAALVLSRASLPRTSWVELKLRDTRITKNSVLLFIIIKRTETIRKTTKEIRYFYTE